ncbi:MAG: hypothetical protein JW990_03150 [Thermoleophilia bacterium]|nr:hypothetical protein [Thermoleophilia bacterium]
MADKKVERSGRERPLTPTQKMKASLSDLGTVNMSEASHDKGKGALVDKFRDREERWRREQSLRDQEARTVSQHEQEAGDDVTAAEAGDEAGAGEPANSPEERGGGAE